MTYWHTVWQEKKKRQWRCFFFVFFSIPSPPLPHIERARSLGFSTLFGNSGRHLLFLTTDFFSILDILSTLTWHGNTRAISRGRLSGDAVAQHQSYKEE